MDILNIILGLISLLVIACFAPLLAGLVNKQKAFWTGRIGAPVLQPYYELRRLLFKETLYAREASLISRVAPVVSLVTLLIAGMMLPVGYFRPLINFDGDIILFVYLLGLSRFVQILAAMDIGSSFEGMGAAREATFSVFAEPIYFFTLGSLAFATGHTSMWDVFHTIDFSDPSFIIFTIVCTISAFLLMVTECSRMPVDDPNTHLELTMIHEVMILDNSGIDLFCYQYGAYIKLMIYATFLACFVNPFIIQDRVIGFVIFTLVLLALSAVLAWVETMTSRFKLKYIPQYLLFAAAIGILNLLIYSFIR